MAAAAVSIDVSQWEQRGGAVLQHTASNGRIRRTFVAPSGEKFRTWKECLKYMEETTMEDIGKKASPMQCSGNASKKRGREKSCEQEELASTDSENEEEPNCEQAPRRMPKRAAAASNLKERRIVLSNKDSLVEVKRERVVDGEDIALLMTAESGEGQPPQRRLLDFIVHDVDGNAQPIELVGAVPLYLTTVIIPQNGTPDKDKGVRCEGFGPLESWSISGYEDGQPVLWVCTDLAEYACLKPAGVYKKQYDMLYEKAVICIEAYRALSKPDGGDPYLDLDELIVRVSRALLSNKKNFKAHIFVREFMLAHGTFIVDQLTALDGNASQDEQLFNGLPALLALESESKNICLISQSTKGTALRIEERGAASNVFTSISNDQTSADTDEKLARLLQEQENRKVSGRRNGRSQNGKGKYYIRINEDEIAGDYPLPAFYKASEEEMDEYVLFDDDTSTLAPEDLPRRMLHDWALYNSDSRLVSLELLPMLCGAETDTDIFGSGIMTEDDGSGYCLDQDMDVQVGDVGGTGSSSSPKATCLSSEDSSKGKHPEGIRIFLSAVKEWMIEFGASMLFVSIRTDGAWYRLGQPSSQYAKWYTPVLKTAKLAIKIITMLKEETRASKLSFLDVTKKLAEQQEDEPTFISSKLLEAQRYVVVHGQIILQQFAEYPDENIKKSAFITGLTSKMEEKHHAKLTFSKKKILLRKGRNLNPRASLRPDGTKPKPMRATTTRLVNRIWSEYYGFSQVDTEDIQQTTLLNKDVDAEEDQEVEDESDAEEERVLAAVDSNELMGKMKSFKNKCSNKVEWLGKSVGITKANELVYKRALVGSEEVNVGGVVLVALEEQTETLSLLLVELLYERKSGSHCCHGRILDRGSQTVLGNAASMQEVFLTSKCADALLSNIRGIVMVDFRKCAWGHAYRKTAFAQNEADRARAKELEKEGLPMEYYCRFMYHPEEGAFFVLPNDILPSGNGICKTCQEREELKQREEMQVFPDREGFRLKGVEYYLNDFLYLAPETFPLISSEIEQLEKFKASRNKGLRAFAVCQLLEIKLNNSSRKSNPNLVQLIVRRFFRPEDTSPQKAYMADVREVYYSEEIDTVGIQAVRGKCEIMKQLQIDGTEATESLNNVFFCNCIFDLKKGTVKQLPANVRLNSSRMSKGKSSSDEFINAKKKGKAPESVEAECESTSLSGRLATLDIFAGCGGLSEGLHQSGVSFTKWAIEYENVAAQAFQLNHPQASVFCENCNVILRCIMEKGGDLDDCISTTEAEELSRKVSNEEKCKLPAQGEVDFISGGPPCQGFSGMNRFNQRAWSKVQCEMILSFLSYVDYFRPRFFLLENVRNFISFNKGQTFRLTLASLLEMGYQVRFGVLQAGNYGVSQSRKRAFIWAASPEETLPEWPEPRHVFASSQLKILLPGGLQYAAVSDAADGAPLRPITVRDTIGDLPPVSNGATKIELAYDKPPESWFQKFIRGLEPILYDHVAKEMNELNYIRCQRIPKRPGADWRDLPEEKVKLSTGQIVDLIPWCLPNTAERHNQWKGLFGRLDWDGNFPTSVTDPQPMGKVGMCFHPEQDRIVTVRECARSQGFPDGYKFCGNIQSKHRQIGNAVPPPLARALGEKLKVVLGLKNCQP